MKFSSSVNRLSEKIYSQRAVYTPYTLLLVTLLVALLNIGFGLFPALPLTLANASAALLMGYAG